MRNFVLFAKPSRIFRYKFATALWLAAVPIATIAVASLILFTFAKLNLYYIESLGVLINAQIREAYYDQLVNEISGVVPHLALLVAAAFVVGFIVMNWATSPFVRARIYIERTILSPRSERRLRDLTVSEDPVFEQTVRDFCTQVASGSKVEATVNVVNRPHNLRFVVKYLLTFVTVSLLAGLSLSSVFFVAYDKIITISLQLVPGKKLTGHYFNAQQDILANAINASVVVALLAYLWIGWKVHRYMALNLFIFSKAITERRFPVALRKRDIYYALAETINKAYAKHKQSRI